MKRIFASCLMALTFLLVGSAIFSSCSNEEVLTRREDTTPRAFTMQLRAGLKAPVAAELGETDGEHDTRATAIDETVKLIFQIKDGTKKFTRDSGTETNVVQKTSELNRELFLTNHSKINILTVIRAKNRKEQVYYDFSEWTYDAAAGMYIKEFLSIPISAGFRMSDDIEVRLAVGGHIIVSEDRKTCKIDMFDNLYKQVDLSNASQAANVEMPIPYISGWNDLVYDEQTVQMTLANADKKVIMDPQGVLLVTTLRNNMSQNITVAGVRMRSNACDFEGEFNLAGDAIQFTPTFRESAAVDMRIANDHFRRKDFKFDAPLSLTANSSNNKESFNHAKVLLTWVMPDGTTGGFNWNSGGANLRQAQTMVWGLDVKGANGQEVTKPNYQIVPIMGTVNTLTPGNSFTLNCEFYNQPEQILGHIAKYTVNAQGTGFDTSHDDAEASLVNWRVAKDFIRTAKSLPMPGGGTATYRMLPAGFAAMLGFGWHSVNFTKDPANGYNKLTTGAEGETGLYFGTDGNFNRPNAIHNLGQTTISSPWPRRTMTYVPHTNPQANGKYVAYRLVGAGTTGRPGVERIDGPLQRTPDLSVIKIEVENNDGYVTHQRYTSIYLGKYWVGTLFAPIFDEGSLVNAGFWSNATTQRNKVERVLPTPGYYNPSTLTASDSDSPVPTNAQRQDVGKIGVIWYLPQGDVAGMGAYLPYKLGRNELTNLDGEGWVKAMKDAANYTGPNDRNFVDYKSVAYYMLMYGLSGNNFLENGQNEALNRSMLFLPLFVYSDTYQGDTAD